MTFFLILFQSTCPNVEDTIRIRIETKGIGMKSYSHDLSIQCKTIHKLTKVTQTTTKHLDNNFVEIFESRPFDT